MPKKPKTYTFEADHEKHGTLRISYRWIRPYRGDATQPSEPADVMPLEVLYLANPYLPPSCILGGWMEDSDLWLRDQCFTHHKTLPHDEQIGQGQA